MRKKPKKREKKKNKNGRKKEGYRTGVGKEKEMKENVVWKVGGMNALIGSSKGLPN